MLWSRLSKSRWPPGVPSATQSCSRCWQRWRRVARLRSSHAPGCLVRVRAGAGAGAGVRVRVRVRVRARARVKVEW